MEVPIINEVRKFDGRILTSDAPPERFLTLEKKAVIVDSFAKFKIDNVETYYTATSGDERRAEELVKKLTRGYVTKSVNGRFTRLCQVSETS